MRKINELLGKIFEDVSQLFIHGVTPIVVAFNRKKSARFVDFSKMEFIDVYHKMFGIMIEPYDVGSSTRDQLMQRL